MEFILLVHTRLCQSDMENIRQDFQKERPDFELENLDILRPFRIVGFCHAVFQPAITERVQTWNHGESNAPAVGRSLSLLPVMSTLTACLPSARPIKRQSFQFAGTPASSMNAEIGSFDGAEQKPLIQRVLARDRRVRPAGAHSGCRAPVSF